MKKAFDVSCLGSARRMLGFVVASIRALPVIVEMLCLSLGSSFALAQGSESQLKALHDQWLKIVNEHRGPQNSLRIAQEYLALSEKTHGPDSRQVALALQDVGASYDDENDFANALLAYQRALGIYKKIGIHDGNACEVQHQISSHIKDPSESITYHVAGLDCFEAVPGVDNKMIRSALSDADSTCGFHLDVPDVVVKCDQLVQHWLPIAQKRFGPNDFSVAGLLQLKGRISAAQNNFDGAWTALRQAIGMVRSDADPIAQDIFFYWLGDALDLSRKRPVDSEYMAFAAERAELATAQHRKAPTLVNDVAAREFLIKARLDSPGVPVPALSSKPPAKSDDEFVAQAKEGDRLSGEAFRSGRPSLYTTAISFHEKLLSVAEERYGPFSDQVAHQLLDLGLLDGWLTKAVVNGAPETSLNDNPKAALYLARAVVTFEREGQLFNSCVSQAELGKVYARGANGQKNRVTEWSSNRAVEWYNGAMDCYVKTSGPTFDLRGDLAKDYIKLLSESHPEQAAVLERQRALRMERAAEWQRILTEASTTRKPVVNANLDAMIKRIPAVKPEAPVQKTVAPTRTPRPRKK